MILNNDFSYYQGMLIVREPSRWIFLCFNIYRLLFSTLLCAMLLTKEHSQLMGGGLPHYADSFAIWYSVTSGLMLVLFWFYKPDTLALILAIFGMIVLDLLILVSLSYFSYNQHTIIASMMLIPVAFGGVLVAGRLSTFLPALAFLGLSFVEFSAWAAGVGSGAQGVYAVGILGSQLFIISYLFQFLSKSLLYNERRASMVEKLQRAEQCAVIAKEELEKTHKKLEALLKSAGEGVLGIDENGQISFANPRAGALLNCGVDEICGQHLSHFLTTRTSLEEETSTRQISNYQTLLATIQIPDKDNAFSANEWVDNRGKRFFVEYSCEKLTGDNGAVVVFQNVTERIKNENLLNHMANHDSLTNIPNRQHFLNTLSHSIGKAKTSGQKLAIFFLDLDHFKFINDNFGHSAGDGVLRIMSKKIRNCIREGDMIARLGGDEFAIMVQNIGNPENSATIAQKILDKISEPIALANNTFQITSSVGISTFPADSEEPERLLKNADTAMYAAKHQGRGTYRFFQHGMLKNSEERRRIQILMHHALQNQEFKLAFQPIIDIKSRQIVSLEVLIRWETEQGEKINPDFFIPIAEETGKIREIGLWVLEKSLTQLSQWKKTLPYSPKISVNVSSKQLSNSDFRLRLTNLLRQHEISPREIALELTETGVMEDQKLCLAELQALYDMGICISIDDFGTGYSSLDYLRRLPLNHLKIDRCFTQGIGESKNDESLIQLMLSVAKSLKLKVIAEGVETEEQLHFLERHGCDQAQGYLFSEPCDASQVGQLFHNDPVAVLSAANLSTAC